MRCLVAEQVLDDHADVEALVVLAGAHRQVDQGLRTDDGVLRQRHVGVVARAVGQVGADVGVLVGRDGMVPVGADVEREARGAGERLAVDAAVRLGRMHEADDVGGAGEVAVLHRLRGVGEVLVDGLVVRAREAQRRVRDAAVDAVDLQPGHADLGRVAGGRGVVGVAVVLRRRGVLVDDLHRLLVVVDQRVEDVGVEDQRLVQQRRLHAQLERVRLLRGGRRGHAVDELRDARLLAMLVRRVAGDVRRDLVAGAEHDGGLVGLEGLGGPGREQHPEVGRPDRLRGEDLVLLGRRQAGVGAAGAEVLRGHGVLHRDVRAVEVGQVHAVPGIDHVGAADVGAVLVRQPRAGGQRQAVGEVPVGLREHRAALVLDRLLAGRRVVGHGDVGQRIAHQQLPGRGRVQRGVLRVGGEPGAGIAAPGALVGGRVVDLDEVQPGLVVDEVAHGRADAQFLADLVVVVPEAAGVAIDVERGAVVVDRVEVVRLPGGDRRQGLAAGDLPVQFGGQAVAAGHERVLGVVVDAGVVVGQAVARVVGEPAARQARRGVGGQRVRGAVRILGGRRREDGVAVGGLAGARLDVAFEARAEAVERRQQELDAARHAVRVRVGLVAVVGVRARALLSIDRERAAPGQQVVDHRAADRRDAQHAVALVERQRVVGRRRERGPLRVDRDAADARVLALQRALRAARHFDGVDVDEVEAGGQRVVAIAHAVEDHADAGVLRLGLADLADAADRQAAGALVADVPRHVGRALGDGRDTVGIETLEFGAGHHRDRHRHVLQPFDAVAAVDGDGVQRRRFVRGVSRTGGAGGRRGGLRGLRVRAAQQGQREDGGRDRCGGEGRVGDDATGMFLLLSAKVRTAH